MLKEFETRLNCISYNVDCIKLNIDEIRNSTEVKSESINNDYIIISYLDYIEKNLLSIKKDLEIIQK